MSAALMRPQNGKVHESANQCPAGHGNAAAVEAAQKRLQLVRRGDEKTGTEAPAVIKATRHLRRQRCIGRMMGMTMGRCQPGISRHMRK